MLPPPVPWCCDDVSDVIVSFLIPNPQHTVDDMYRCITFTRLYHHQSVYHRREVSLFPGSRELDDIRLCADEDLSRDKEKTNLFFWVSQMLIIATASSGGESEECSYCTLAFVTGEW